MATKTKKETEANIERFYRFKVECLKRRPGWLDACKKFSRLAEKYASIYSDDETCKKYGKRLDKCASKLEGEMSKIESEYKYILLPADTESGEAWKLLRERTRAVIKLPKVNDRPDEQDLEVLLCDDPRTVLTVQVDIFREKTIIKQEFLALLDKEKKSLEAKGLTFEEFDKGPHLENTARYFRVYELRDKRPPTPYRNIAAIIIKEGLCENIDINAVEGIVKQNYATIFQQIFDMPYKKYDKKALKHSDFKGCTKCPKRDMCKELCPEAEYAVSLTQVTQKEKLPEKGLDNML